MGDLPSPGQSRYRYKGWLTGKAWACHVTGPYCWERAYGFADEREAAWWALDRIEEFGAADALRDEQEATNG